VDQQKVSGSPASKTTLGSVWTRFVYDPLDRKTREIDGAGTSSERQTITLYDAADNPISVTTGYSPVSSILTVDGKGQDYSAPVTTFYQYDPLGRVRLVRDGYIDPQELPFVEYVPGDPRNGWSVNYFPAKSYGHTRPWTAYTYDASGHVLSVRTNVSNSATADQRSSSTAGDPVSQTTYIYDKLGRLAQTNEGESATGDQSQMRVTVQLYDSLDRVVATLQMGQPWTQYTYDGFGELTKQTAGVTDPRMPPPKPGTNNSPTLYSTYEYDIFGDVTVQGDQTGAGGTITRTYDLLGRVKSQVQKANLENLTYKYDADGNLLQTTDTVYPLWYATATAPGGLQLQISISLPSVTRTTTTSYTYDALNRPISTTDTYWTAAPNNQSGHTTRTWYDALGRVEATWAPDGKIRWFGYDAAGDQVIEYWGTAAPLAAAPAADGTPSVSAAPLNPVGTGALTKATAIVTYSNAAGQVTYSFQATTTLQPVETRDPTNALTRFVFVVPVARASWTVVPYTWTAMTYDGLGRLETESTQGTSTQNVTFTYGYDAAGRVTQVSDSQGGWQKTAYDLAGRITAESMSDGTGTIVYFSFAYYDGTDWGQKAPTFRTDRLKSITGRNGGPNGTAVVGEEIQYDALGREARRSWTTVGPTAPREQLLTSYQSNGLVSTQTRTGEATIRTGRWVPSTTLYSYDATNQVLQQSTLGLDGSTWEPGKLTPHDAAGNAPYVSQAAAQGTGNRVSSQNGYTLGYDGTFSGIGTAGNVTSVAKGSALDVYTLDGRNRVTQVSRAMRGQQYSIDYTYDTFDRLVARSKTSVSPTGHTERTSAIRYLYANGQPYADATTGGTITVRYLFGPAGQPLARLLSGTSLPDFYMTDRQDSVLQLVDATGHTLKRIRYTGLTVAERAGPAGSPGSAGSDRFELAAQVSDQQAGLAMLNGQWFNPALGRYLSAGGPGIGLNPYPVAGNDAPNDLGPGADPWGTRMKPTGHDTFEAIGQAWSDITLAGWLLDAAGFDREQAGKTAAGVWGMGYGASPVGLGENALPRDAGSGQLQWPWQWSADGSVSRQVRSWQLAYAGYRQAGYSHDEALNWVWGTNAPVRGSMYKLMEMRYRVSFQGTNFGQKLAPSDYVLNAVHVGVDVTTTALGVAGVAARALALTGLTGRTALAVSQMSRLGRLASVGRTAVELAGVATGMPTPWGVAGMSRWLAQPLVRFGVHTLVKQYGSEANYARAQAMAQWLGFKACFVAGTPIQGPHGAKAIEEFKSYEEHGDACDRIVSRNEHEPDGVLTLRRVLRTFVRTGLVLNLKLPGGIIIGTTAEHPFFVNGQGWTPAQELKVGDQIRLMEPGWTTVEGVADTGRIETVYNLEIEDDHTYFVGTDEGRFSVWAHNAQYGGTVDYDTIKLLEHKAAGWTGGKIDRVERNMREAVREAQTQAKAQGRELTPEQVDALADQAFIDYVTRNMSDPQRPLQVRQGEAQCVLEGIKVKLGGGTGDTPPMPGLNLTPQDLAAAMRKTPDYYGHLDEPRCAKYANNEQPHLEMMAVMLRANRERWSKINDTPVDQTPIHGDWSGVPLVKPPQKTKGGTFPDNAWNFEHRIPQSEGGTTILSNLYIEASLLNIRKHNH
jgi:YD repeat-containing protein